MQVQAGQLSAIAEQYVVWMAGMVGAENVKMVTILTLVLVGFSVLGMVLKIVKNFATAFILAVGITVICGSLGLQANQYFDEGTINTVIERVQNSIK